MYTVFVGQSVKCISKTQNKGFCSLGTKQEDNIMEQVNYLDNKKCIICFTHFQLRALMNTTQMWRLFLPVNTRLTDKPLCFSCSSDALCW